MARRKRMEKLFLITGAAGHLGSAITAELKKTGCRARGLVERDGDGIPSGNIAYFTGDVTNIESLEPFFEGSGIFETYCIHAAGLISIQDKGDGTVHKVNVDGTRNIISMCRRHNVRRLLYVSSVHAIKERKDLSVQVESEEFFPEDVRGEYAKTKAEATALVLEAGRHGLDTLCVHPSGITGPGDDGRNHLVQVAKLFLQGRLPLWLKGGYDMVDVRDVAKGCLLALGRGRPGECYILSNRYVTIREYLSYLAQVSGTHGRPCLPVGIARFFYPLLLLHSKMTGQRPLYTRYSLSTIDGTVLFSHDKATRELGYTPRDIRSTVRDMYAYLVNGTRYDNKKEPGIRKMQAFV